MGGGKGGGGRGGGGREGERTRSSKLALYLSPAQIAPNIRKVLGVTHAAWGKVRPSLLDSGLAARDHTAKASEATQTQT